MSRYLLKSMILPCVTNEASRPGCGKSMTSGALPASMAALIEASNSFEP